MTDTNRGMGDNLGVDQAQIVNDRLEFEYGHYGQTLEKMLEEARQRAPKVTSDEMALERGGKIKQFRDLDTRLEGIREAEKLPFLRGGNAVDSYFFKLRDLIARRKKGDRSVKPGIIDVMQGEIDAWQEQKRLAEQARLEAERLETQRKLREEQERLRKAREEAEAAERAAARARSEATIAQRRAEAEARLAAEAEARNRAALAAEKAREAELATMAKPADMVRLRGNDASGAGVTLTTAREGYAMLVDRAQLDMNALRPYFTDFELEKALRGWAKATGHVQQMPGAEVGFKNKGVTR